MQNVYNTVQSSHQEAILFVLTVFYFSTSGNNSIQGYFIASGYVQMLSRMLTLVVADYCIS